MKKEKTITQEDLIKQEYDKALTDYKNALTMFDYADDEYFDIVNETLTATKMLLDIALKKAKKLGVKVDCIKCAGVYKDAY